MVEHCRTEEMRLRILVLAAEEVVLGVVVVVMVQREYSL
jgi:hypothetical protein